MSYAFMRFPQFKELAFTLSYDDGVPADKRLAEIFNKNGLKCTFNLNGETAHTVGRYPIEEVKNTYLPAGHEVAAHGACHYSLGEIPDGMLIENIMANRKALEELFDVVVTGLAYANGSFDDRVVNLLKTCGITYARTIRSTHSFEIPNDWLRLDPTCHHKDPKLMELAEAFLKGGNKRHFFYHRPQLFYLWGHSYEFDNDDNWQMMEDFCKFIGGREDVWYATNGEIYEYVQAYNALQYSADGHLVKNPTAIDVYIHYFGKPYIIPSGKTVLLEKDC